MSKLRIMLADDHETVREGLKMIVNAQDDMEVVGLCGRWRRGRSQSTGTPAGYPCDGYLHAQTERAESNRENH